MWEQLWIRRQKSRAWRDSNALVPKEEQQKKAPPLRDILMMVCARIASQPLLSGVHVNTMQTNFRGGKQRIMRGLHLLCNVSYAKWLALRNTVWEVSRQQGNVAGFVADFLGRCRL